MELGVLDVELGPLLGVREDLERLDELLESHRVAALRVVRMEALGQVAEYALNRVLVGTWRDLQHLVVVGGFQIGHDFLDAAGAGDGAEPCGVTRRRDAFEQGVGRNTRAILTRVTPCCYGIVATR